MENRCIVCGEIIPEGRQICPNCEKERDAYDPVMERDCSVPGRRFCRNHDHRTGERE